MAKPNYAFAKRQRELAKKQKLEEKRLRKASGLPDLPEDGAVDTPESQEASVQAAPPEGDAAQPAAGTPATRES